MIVVAGAIEFLLIAFEACCDCLSNTKQWICRFKQVNSERMPLLSEDDGQAQRSTTRLNVGDDEELEIRGYRHSKFKNVISWILYLLTAGLLRLVFYWKPNWMASAVYDECSLSEAEHILITNLSREFFLEPVRHSVCTNFSMESSARVGKKQLRKQSPQRRQSYSNPEGEDPGVGEQALRDDFEAQYFGLKPGSSDNRLANFQLPQPDGPGFLNVVAFKYFKHKKIKYVWYYKNNGGQNDGRNQFGQFVRLPALDKNIPCSYFANCRPLDKATALSRQAVYNLNHILVKIKPIATLLVLEVLNPFYLFQVFSVAVWFSEGYNYYAGVIILMSVLSVSVAVYQIRRNQRKLRDTVASFEMVTVLRPGSDPEPYAEVVPSTILVPGDVILIPEHGCSMDCDAVLQSGCCIVNESMLTGESVPVTKTPIPAESEDSDQLLIYNHKEHDKHTLYGGTRVLQTRQYDDTPVTAVVIRTGFATTKGQLVRAIMYPKPVDFHFINDLLKFVVILFAVAGLGFLYTIVLMVHRGYDAKKIALRALDIVTIVVPPALPAAMTIGIIAARQRLVKQKIFCISPNVINTSGAIDVVLFDKTGTLTEDGLDFACVVPVYNGSFQAEVKSLRNIPLQPISQCLATCNALTLVNRDLSGDPIDMVLFTASGYSYEENPRTRHPVCTSPVPDDEEFTSVGQLEARQAAHRLEILHHYPFSSSLQRMSVIVTQNDELVLFSKGSPEAIVALSDPATVPENFTRILANFTSKGYRVLGAGFRKLTDETNSASAHNLPRGHAESNLQFIGLIVLENSLKPETKPALATLISTNIRPIMATGDNIQTAVSVARQCSIIQQDQPVFVVEVKPASTKTETTTVRGAAASIVLKEVHFETKDQEMAALTVSDSKSFEVVLGSIEDDGGPDFRLQYSLAMTGVTFSQIRKLFPESLPRLAASVAVWARMAPEQKALVVHELQQIGYVVCMCGDGANDCGALKASHVGVSLSEAEASIASPFTSQQPNIDCVVTLIREGRAALVCSFGIFKYMVLYSLAQFFAVLILYWVFTNLSDFQFLYQDLFLTTTYAICFGYTPATDFLTRQRPPTRVFSLASLASIVGQIGVAGFFQLFIYFFVELQPWFYSMPDPGDENNYNSYQGTAVFLQSAIQFTILAVVYSGGGPFRKAVYHNIYLTAALLITTAISIWVIMYPEPEWLRQFLELKMPPFMEFRGFILLLVGCNLLAAVLVEKVLVNWLLFGPCTRKGWYHEGTSPKYLAIMDEIRASPQWLTTDVQYVEDNRTLLTPQDSINNGDRGKVNSAFNH